MLRLILAGVLFGVAMQGVGAPAAGEAVYKQHCAECHDGGALPAEGAEAPPVPAPSLSQMRQMSAVRISFALRSGKMREQGRLVRGAEFGVLMGYLTGDRGESFQLTAEMRCEEPARARIDLEARIGSWGLDRCNTRSLTTGAAGIDRRNVARLALKWAFGMPRISEARSQPVVTRDTIFLATVAGNLFALDRESGCVKWMFTAGGPLRSALSLGEVGEGRPALFFAGRRTRVYALDPTTGSVIWETPIDLFPQSIITGSPIQFGRQVFVPISSHEVGWAMNPEYECCKSHGAVAALDGRTGALEWLTPTIDEPAVETFENSRGTQQWGPSGAPVWTTPAIDPERGLVYFGTGENTSSPPSARSDAIVAFDMKTGEIRWTYQATAGDAYNMACVQRVPGPNCPPENGPDFDFGASVIIAQNSAGRPILLAGQKSGEIHALDPDRDGAVVWKTRIGGGTTLGGVHWGMSVVGERLFAAIADPEFPRPGYTPRPGLYALDVDDGKVVWSVPVERGCELEGRRRWGEPWPPCSFYYGLSAAIMATPELVFTAALDGKIRIFGVADGELLWQYDTKRPFQTVNGVKAHGGAVDNAGVQVADGLLFVQSGYLYSGQMPGNAFLVFEVR